MTRLQLDEFGRLDAGLGDLLRSMAHGLASEQRRLDEDYLRQLEAAGQLATRLPPGWDALVAALAPSRWTLSEVSVAAELRFAERAERELGVGIELLHLGYRRRYAYAATVSNKVTLLVRQTALAPADAPRPGSPSTSGEEDPVHGER